MTGGTDLIQWFKQKYNEFRETIGFKSKQHPKWKKQRDPVEIVVVSQIITTFVKRK